MIKAKAVSLGAQFLKKEVPEVHIVPVDQFLYELDRLFAEKIKARGNTEAGYSELYPRYKTIIKLAIPPMGDRQIVRRFEKLWDNTLGEVNKSERV